jgi:hypothetical protein
VSFGHGCIGRGCVEGVSEWLSLLLQTACITSDVVACPGGTINVPHHHCAVVVLCHSDDNEGQVHLSVQRR